VDVLRFKGGPKGDTSILEPNDARSNENEWVLYFSTEAGDDDLVGTDKQMRGRKVVTGSFDPTNCAFDPDAARHPIKVTLAPARNRCLSCGSFAGAGSVITPVALGTSAAVRVLCEGLVESLAKQNAQKDGHDGKERLLVFADSRQDAAHQARFITYAARYDRMRWRLLRGLDAAKGAMTIDEAVRELVVQGVDRRDNPHTSRYDDFDYLPESVRTRAAAWEEAPLLDDLAVSSGYRGTVFNLGLVGVRYQHLAKHVEREGGPIAARLGINAEQLEHLCRSVLDEMRRRQAVSRRMLAYHPANASCPEEFKASADWERGFKDPVGFPCSPNGDALAHLESAEIPEGVTLQNAWRKARGGGRAPRLERRVRHLLNRFGAREPGEDDCKELMQFLMRGPHLVTPAKLHGYRKARELLQVNADTLQLVRLDLSSRSRCSVCFVRMPWSRPGLPCPDCRGVFEPWPEVDVLASRSVQRLLRDDEQSLFASEHTAQITGDERIEIEERFKGPASKSPLNVLSCSPTLEMGIDVGGLDAVVLRNVPPRPDNYAQRGGRAGRRTRVGIVIGYTRHTPHDGYFYDKPEEMIAGEVPAPGLGLGNRDVLLRHLFAIAFGAAEPGLAGRMYEYVTLQGEANAEKIEALISAVMSCATHAVDLALDAWGAAILVPAGFDTREELLAAFDELPTRVRDLFARVQRQVRELEAAIERWRELGHGDRSAVHAMDLKRRLLGLRDEKDSGRGEADDRSGGHPMRRFAEFGILPGYEFPDEPCTVRLLGDPHEEDPISVERRFGIAQYQPEAKAHARGHRWRVVGLDPGSPWNPKTPDPTWVYARCRKCALCYGSQEHTKCPRCKSTETLADALPGHDYGGFLAVRDDTPVLEEEDRFSISALVNCNPQWNGRLIERLTLPTGWPAEIRREEEIRWVNEWKKPTPQDDSEEAPRLHENARGFYLCPHCGKLLVWASESKKKQGRQRAKTRDTDDRFKHAPDCPKRGQPPKPLAITATSEATTLRIRVPLPPGMEPEDYLSWGNSLGFALRTGMRQLYMLDGDELEFELEPMWETQLDDGVAPYGSLLFIDPAVGGSGFLDRAAHELHIVAMRALDHLDHKNCESACYRCLKSYQNQRLHGYLNWVRVVADLEELRREPPTSVPLDRSEVDDPKPWLEAYSAGVGSPLELKFLRLFESAGIAVDKQVPVAANDGEAPISAADFVVTGTHVAIYVDGASFHVGHRLRRDHRIREKLRHGNAKWQVIALRASDLGKPNDIVSAIQSASVRARDDVP
jgi:hypothetical protein